MAKQDNLAKFNRRSAGKELRSIQEKNERRRNLTVFGIVGLAAALIIGVALIPVAKEWLNERKFSDKDVQAIGAPAKVCSEIVTKPATGEQQHVTPGTPLDFADSPPTFGTHYDTWEPIQKKFYSKKDRPEMGYLVHNLEHGYTILWYDETAAKDDDVMNEIKGLASKFNSDDTNYRNKFKAAPWTAEDGEAFPEGKHIALTHWSVGRSADGEEGEHVGVWQYCSEPSGAALEDFMKKYPYTDTPEPNAI